MTKSTSNGAAAELPGLDRINALFNWRLPKAPAYPEFPLASFQALATDLTEAYSQAWSQQMEASSAATDRLAGLMQRLVGARDPQSILAVEAEIVTCLTETGSANAKIWSQTAQRLQGCCSDFAKTATKVDSNGSSDPTPAAST